MGGLSFWFSPGLVSHPCDANFKRVLPRGGDVPICDYERRASRDEKRTFEDPGISETNKDHLRRFLMAYDAGAARRGIFLREVRFLLRATEDIKEEMTDRDRMNRIFREWKCQYSPATYATIVNVSLCLVRWINEGEKPKGFLNIKSPSKKKVMRDLEAADMIRWEEGVALSTWTRDIQLKASIQMQLDCGFRPSELIDLRYGDIQLYGRLGVAYVRRGKTGSRHVVFHRCLAVVAQWMAAHPTKGAKDPLWISDGSRVASRKRQRINPCTYAAMRKRILSLGKRADFCKPLDFYNLRHSSCVLDKLDNVPPDLAAERHGHSVEHYVEVYGRLSDEDVRNRFRLHYGLQEDSGSIAAAKVACGRCGAFNSASDRFCPNCGTNTRETVSETSGSPVPGTSFLGALRTPPVNWSGGLRFR